MNNLLPPLIILGGIAFMLLLAKIVGPDRVTQARDDAMVRYWESKWSR